MRECWRGVGAQYCNVITDYCQNNINVIMVLSGVKFLTFALPTIHIVIHKHHRYRQLHMVNYKHFIYLVYRTWRASMLGHIAGPQEV